MTDKLKLVLDTNIVLDWLVFDNAFMNGLRAGVRDGRVIVITHQPAIDELQRVLGYSTLKLSAAQQAEILSEYRARTETARLPSGFSMENLMLPRGFPTCRDPDDQHFLALTFHAKVGVLASRDKALLKLINRVRKFGITILNVSQLVAMVS